VCIADRSPSRPLGKAARGLLQRSLTFPSQAPATDAISPVHLPASGGSSDEELAGSHEADSTIRTVRTIRGFVGCTERPRLPGRQGEEILADFAD
jgi:hypothetical protein